MSKPYAVQLYTTAHVELLVEARDAEEAVIEARRLASAHVRVAIVPGILDQSVLSSGAEDLDWEFAEVGEW